MNFFGLSFPMFRRRIGHQYRKRLGVYSYKMEKNHYHKMPGAVPLRTMENLKKKGTSYHLGKIHQLKRDSYYPFGKWRPDGRFLFDKNRVPFMDVPDLTDFDLKPYVSVHTPWVLYETRMEIKDLNNYNDPKVFGRFDQNIQVEEK